MANPDPIAHIANLGWCLALADHLGDMHEDIERAWKECGLGEIPQADGGESRGEGMFPYSCGDIMLGQLTERHGVAGLWRKHQFTVTLTWSDDFGQQYEDEYRVLADTPMDAARVAYHEGCEQYSRHEIGHVTARVSGEYEIDDQAAAATDERFEMSPVVGVLVERATTK